MKKVTILIALMLSILSSFSQQTEPSHVLSSEDYLKKSKNQRTGARVLLIGGAAALTASILILAPGKIAFDDMAPVLTLGALGGAATLASIPVFIASGRNKRRAIRASAYINLKSLQNIQQQNIVFRRYPAVSFRVAL